MIKLFDTQDPNGSKAFHAESHSKLIASFYRNDADQTVSGRDSRIHFALKDSINYETVLAGMNQDQFVRTAGCDLSALFMPFESRVGTWASGLPSFHQSISTSGSNINGGEPNTVDLLPFEWDITSSGSILDRYYAPSGDGLNCLVSDSEYRGDTNRLRDTSRIRSIGLRLPAVGVGWGYTTDDEPWPSGTTTDGSGIRFAGGYKEGYNVDPTNYIAAPIDFRYDKQRNVWTAGKENGFWAKILCCASGGILQDLYDVHGGTWNDYWYSNAPTVGYEWCEQVASGSKFYNKINGRTYQNSRIPAYEANNHFNVASGTIVWLDINRNPYRFDCGVSKRQSWPSLNPAYGYHNISITDKPKSWIYSKPEYIWESSLPMWNEFGVGDIVETGTPFVEWQFAYASGQLVLCPDQTSFDGVNIRMSGKPEKYLAKKWHSAYFGGSGLAPSQSSETWEKTDICGMQITIPVVGHKTAFESNLRFDDYGQLTHVNSIRGCRFPVIVNITVDGGNSGSKTNQCSYTYTVKDIIDGGIIGSGLSPYKARPARGAMVAGDGFGIGFFIGDDAAEGVGYYDFLLWDANETFDVNNCN